MSHTNIQYSLYLLFHSSMIQSLTLLLTLTGVYIIAEPALKSRTCSGIIVR